MVKELRVTPIRNGTVIDHIPPGMGLKILSILMHDDPAGRTMTLAMNVSSARQGKKDVLKVEDLELTPEQVGKIALLAPEGTINIIRDSNVVKKEKVVLPDRVVGIVRCGNPNCITNQREPVEPEFVVVSRSPPRLRCLYCERELEDIIGNIL
ncbi:MAG: aspartate carbamoyltransferase regulatory subunit [Thermoplasmata archaeon]|nr:aspartate carbamoyltransferase regulatory subunit [Thermoplasmata archaeon]